MVTLTPELLERFGREAQRTGGTVTDAITARLLEDVGERAAVSPPIPPSATPLSGTVDIHLHEWNARSKVTGLRTCRVEGCGAVQR